MVPNLLFLALEGPDSYEKQCCLHSVELVFYLVLGGQFGPWLVCSAVILMSICHLYVVIELDDLPLLQLFHTGSKTQLHTDANQPLLVSAITDHFFKYISAHSTVHKEKWLPYFTHTLTTKSVQS